MKRSERGFTLIEILVVVAIVALIAIAASMTTFQVLAGTKRSNDHMTAIRQVQNAGYWISNDAQMAQGVDTEDNLETPEVEFITLTWTNWVDDEEHKVYYTFHDMADGLKKLKRQYLIYDDKGDVKRDEVTLVAEYIYYDPNDPDSTSFSPQEDGVWKLRIQASSGTVTETREYEVNPRVNM